MVKFITDFSKKAAAFVAVIASILPLSAQTEVAEFFPGVTTDGISYFLPKTRLHITVEATCTTHTPGEYAPYAAAFLRLNDVTEKTHESWTLTHLEVTPFGVADSSRAYTIRFKAKTVAPLVTLTPDGCLLAVNAETAQPAPLSQPSTETLPSPVFNADASKTPDMLAATSPRKAAELAAAEIYDIRENRALLAKGQADFMPKDGDQLKLMLENLDQQEKGLLQLFQGTSSTTRHTITLDYEPTNFEGQPQVLFRFSPEKGFLEPTDTEGLPYCISTKDEHSLPTETIDPKAAKKEIEDMRYCVCSNASTQITGPDGNIMWQQVMPFAQIGRVEHLGGDLFNKKYLTRIFLHATTGSLLKLEADPVLK